jgi:arylsulfatase A-like enzyme
VLLAIASAALLTGCSSTPEPFRFERASIVLIDLSGLRADRLGAFGGDRSAAANLDALAADSVAFEWAFTPSPYPGPARAALLTGRYPVALGVLADGGELVAETHTLAESLAEHGYRTAGFVDGPAGVEGLSQGFDHWDETSGDLASVVARAVEWLGDAGTEPFFLYLQASPFDLSAAEHEGSAPRERRYAQALLEADGHLGDLLRTIDQTGHSERAVVADTSDHGAELADRGEPASGAVGSVHAGVSRVPLLLRLPQRLQRHEPRATDLVDLAPTLLDLVGIEPDPKTQGESLVAILDQRGRPPTWPPARWNCSRGNSRC